MFTRSIFKTADMAKQHELLAGVSALLDEGLFCRETKHDTFKRERIPSTYSWEFAPKGQHLEQRVNEKGRALRAR
jgi:pyruvate dehydrogenase complex dehydrogenase (E1) component